MEKMESLIRQMLEIEPTINIVLDSAPSIYIVPSVLTEDCTEFPENIGKLEYQVSDHVAGKRSFSYDFYTWEEAKDMAIELHQKCS